MKRTFIILSIGILVLLGVMKLSTEVNVNPKHAVGDHIDSLNNVIVFYNGAVNNVEERNTVDGYNLGLKYQCVEFVKRYYYEYYKHKMPDTYGHAKSFFLQDLKDGAINPQRNLRQYTNPGGSKPRVGDVVVMKGTVFNEYGHVAIISEVEQSRIQIIQQNPGPFTSSREWFELTTENGLWRIKNDLIMGWLRK